ncbi:unnamed protein product [Ilex paraguariensis]|uniref:non-specific serine/threonine protein kinase n=1 Tax=Ilex paraguariensis TaxID=185542 RepID=A0ABC8V3Q4_9AQUA
MQSLYLSGNGFHGVLPSNLSNLCSALVELDLSSNNLSGTVPESFGACSVLELLDISDNNFSGELPIGTFLKLSNLKDLVLSFNAFVGSLPESLSNLTNLETLDVSSNNISGLIPSGICQDPRNSLKMLYLQNNIFTGSIPESLASFGSLENLAILKLGNNSISWSISGELGDCCSLIWLDLNTNFLNGTIPPAMFKQSGKIALALLTGKMYVYIKNDGSKQCHGAWNLLESGGIRQEQLDRISSKHPCNFTRVYRGSTKPTFNHNGSMIFLDLSYNKLDGSIPKELGSTYYLSILNLGHNVLSGPIPPELGGLMYVASLDLSYNSLNGSIPPSLTGLAMLVEIDLSNNHLSGMIPESFPFDTFPDYRFLNNSGLCGYPLPPCGAGSGASLNQHQKSHRRQASLAGSVAMGLLFSLFCIFGVMIIIAVESRKKEDALEAYVDGHSNSATANSASRLTTIREALSVNLATFDQPLLRHTSADLLEATNGFHNESLIGSGNCPNGKCNLPIHPL